jgi:hypothetical protein
MITVAVIVKDFGKTLLSMFIFPSIHSETIPFVMSLQAAALELGTNQGGEQKRHLTLLWNILFHMPILLL